jgi:hypothetical protein
MEFYGPLGKMNIYNGIRPSSITPIGFMFHRGGFGRFVLSYKKSFKLRAVLLCFKGKKDTQGIVVGNKASKIRLIHLMILTSRNILSLVLLLYF